MIMPSSNRPSDYLGPRKRLVDGDSDRLKGFDRSVQYHSLNSEDASTKNDGSHVGSQSKLNNSVFASEKKSSLKSAPSKRVPNQKSRMAVREFLRREGNLSKKCVMILSSQCVNNGESIFYELDYRLITIWCDLSSFSDFPA